MIIKGGKMTFEPLIEMNPDKIDDIDGLIMPTAKSRSEIDYDFRKLGKKKCLPKRFVNCSNVNMMWK